MNRLVLIILAVGLVFQLNLLADSNITIHSVETIIEDINSVEDLDSKAFVLSHELGVYFKKYNFYFTLGGFDSARLLLFMFIITIAFLIRKAIVLLFGAILNGLFSITDKKNNFSDHKDLIHKTLEAAKMPFLWFYIVYCIKWAFKFLYYPIDLPGNLELIVNISHLTTVSWFLLSFFSKLNNVLLRYVRKGKSDMPEENIRFIILSIKILIVIGSFLFLVNILIPDIQKSFIFSGVSLGLLAIFSKDQANTYSATSKIIFHKKIKVGSWIYGYYAGKPFSGVIVKIGLTHIDIRDFEEGLLTFSNTRFIESFIGTYSDRKVRRVKFDFYLPIFTNPLTVDIIVKHLQNYIDDHPDVSKKLNYHIDNPKSKSEIEREIGASETRLVDLVDIKNGFRINVYCYTNEDNWKLQRSLKHNLILESAIIAKSHGVRMSIEGKYIQGLLMDNDDDKSLGIVDIVNNM